MSGSGEAVENQLRCVEGRREEFTELMYGPRWLRAICTGNRRNTGTGTHLEEGN